MVGEFVGRTVGRIGFGGAALKQAVGQGDHHGEDDAEDAVGPTPANGGHQVSGQGCEDGLSDGVAAVGQAEHATASLREPRGQRGRHGEGRDAGVADAGENPVEDEHLPEIGGIAGGNPAEQDAETGQGEQDPRAPPVQEDPKERRGEGADEAGRGEYAGGVGRAAAE